MKKFIKGFKFYSVATQGILTMLLLCVVGMYIGYNIDADSLWPGVLGAVGVLCGLIILITYLLYLVKEEGDKDEKGE